MVSTEKDLKTALGRVGIRFDGWLPRAKTGSPRANLRVSDLSRNQRDRIRAAFEREYKSMGYGAG